MAERGGAGTKWTRDETVAALSLYCQIPFGQMRHENARVIDLAKRLGRTPASIAMKLGNLASFDPFHQARGVGGLPNASALDKEVWDEFYGKWDVLAAAYEAPEEIGWRGLGALAEATGSEVGEVSRGIPEDRDTTAPTEKISLATMRIGQQFFRSAVLSAYGGSCCVTGIAASELLRASHIVPWAERRESRLNPANGLCLNALHDAAFDRGLITIGEDWTLRVSGRVKGAMPQATYERFFLAFDGGPVRRPERWVPAGEYLEWHRGRVFRAA